MREVLKNVSCPACGGPSHGDEERKLTLQKLIQENTYLKQEVNYLHILLFDYTHTHIFNKALTLNLPHACLRNEHHVLSLNKLGNDEIENRLCVRVCFGRFRYANECIYTYSSYSFNVMTYMTFFSYAQKCMLYEITT